MIEVTGLGKTFSVTRKQKVTAIHDVSFHAEDGRVTGLLGPNGAGKSTTLRILATLMQASSGTAVIDGYDVHTSPLDVRRRIGFLPHDSGIYPRLTARENVQYYADICGVPVRQSKQRIDELIELLDMQDFADRRAQGFSQGQKTKVALARALVHNPKTLMLDEPTNGLDIMATRGLRNIIRRLADEGHCVLFSSHIMQEIEALCDHIAVISDGTVVIEDSLLGIRSNTGQYNLEDAFVIAIGESLDTDP
ncbi:MAG: ATP-binding cassette domain-containing protein [Granulosicoccus sp.]|nr:ATP-binding cassette domain-containing protein [Granulosicoccus sp.]